jgi:hypothetical protein
MSRFQFLAQVPKTHMLCQRSFCLFFFLFLSVCFCAAVVKQKHVGHVERDNRSSVILCSRISGQATIIQITGYNNLWNDPIYKRTTYKPTTRKEMKKNVKGDLLFRCHNQKIKEAGHLNILRK